MRHKQLQLDINEYYYNYEYYNAHSDSNTNRQYIDCLKACLNIALEKEITGIQKEILKKYYYEDKKMSQIAKERGVTIGVISKQIKSAKKKIRSKLEYFEAIYKICKMEEY